MSVCIRLSRHCTLVVSIITFSSSFFSRSPSSVDLSLHRFLSILGLFPVTFSVFIFILLRFDSQSSLSAMPELAAGRRSGAAAAAPGNYGSNSLGQPCPPRGRSRGQPACAKYCLRQCERKVAYRTNNLAVSHPPVNAAIYHKPSISRKDQE